MHRPPSPDRRVPGALSQADDGGGAGPQLQPLRGRHGGERLQERPLVEGRGEGLPVGLVAKGPGRFRFGVFRFGFF